MKRYILSCSVLSDSVTPCTVAHQAPLALRILQAKYWSRLLCPPPGDLPNPVIRLRSTALKVNSKPSEPPGNP